MKRFSLFIIFSIILLFQITAESPGTFMFNITPGLNIPLAVTITDQSDDYYSLGGGVRVSVSVSVRG